MIECRQHRKIVAILQHLWIDGTSFDCGQAKPLIVYLRNSVAGLRRFSYGPRQRWLR